MGQGQSSVVAVSPTSNRPLLIVDRVNVPTVIKSLLKLGCDGVKLDVYSKNRIWYVGDEQRCTLTWDDYWHFVSTDLSTPSSAVIKNGLKVVYVDIKTPDVSNMSHLGDVVLCFPGVKFLFSTAHGRDAKYMLRLPPNCTLVADEMEAHALWYENGRRFWLAIRNGGNKLIGQWPYQVDGRLGLTYNDINDWKNAVHLDATIVTRDVLESIYKSDH
jgi:hypothetical protein